MKRTEIFLHKLVKDLRKTETSRLDVILKFFIAEMLAKGAVLWLLSLSFLPFFSRQTLLFLHLVARRTHIASNARFVTGFFVRIDETPQKRLLIFALFFLVWGALDIIEAVGILQRRRWAEYLTVVGTALFIPVEIYTTLTRFSFEKVIITLFNIFLVYYFIRSRKLFQFNKE